MTLGVAVLAAVAVGVGLAAVWRPSRRGAHVAGALALATAVVGFGASGWLVVYAFDGVAGAPPEARASLLAASIAAARRVGLISIAGSAAAGVLSAWAAARAHDARVGRRPEASDASRDPWTPPGS